MDTALDVVANKVAAGERLDLADTLACLRTTEVHRLGALARQVRLARHGRRTFYNLNRHCNYSNLCVLSCKFCEFHRKPGQEGAYDMSVKAVVTEARKAVEAGATEMHIVGGLHPSAPFSYYTDLLEALRVEAPGVHIKAFTAVELAHLCVKHKRAFKGEPGAGTVRAVLEALIAAGLGSLPGGGAEVFDDRAHNEAWRGKIGGEQWLEIHRTAHELGLMSNATMLYGHVETLEERAGHLLRLREAQDEAIAKGHAGRFQTFIPLPFFPDGSELAHLPGPTALDNLRLLATSRLVLDNFDHIKCFWIMQTLEMAQLALDYGVDDVDGTVVWYDITKAVGEGNHQETTAADLRRMILQAGYEPVERDTLYRPVRRDGHRWQVEEEGPVTRVGGQ